MDAALPSPLLGLTLLSAASAAVWTALTVSAIVLAVLWRTKIRKSAPWKKCAVLSLWIHILLACLATTVQLFSGGPGQVPDDDPGPPIKVALADLEEYEDQDQEPLAPEWNEPTAAPLATPAEEPIPEPVAPEPPATPDETAVAELVDVDRAAERQPAPPLEAPPLMTPKPMEIETQAASDAEPEVSDAATDEVAHDDVEPSTIEDDLPPQLATSIAAADETAEPDAAPEREQAVADQTPAWQPTPPTPQEYADRMSANRAELVRARGGNENTERAVRSALAWLATAQSEDGRWEPARFGAGHERRVLNQDRGGAGARAETGISSLALLAMLGAGNTHQDGEYADNVARGLDFLRRSQTADGNLSGQAEPFARMYCHSMATFALAEAYAITRDRALEHSVRAATAYSLAAQHPSDGGWRYFPGNTGDTSQLGWQLMALSSAESAGIAVPQTTWTRVERFLRQVRRGSAGGLASYQPNGLPTRSMTAEALYCRQLLGARIGGGLHPATVAEAAESLRVEPPSVELLNLYYWYYATLALHHAQHSSPTASKAWQEWNAQLVRTLLATQQKDGSWPESCLWGGYGGRVYATAMAAMCLEVYYRYAPPAEDLPSGSGMAERYNWQARPTR